MERKRRSTPRDAAIAALHAERTRLDDALVRREQIKARSALVSAEETTRLRKRAKRRQFLVGEWVLAHADDQTIGAVLDGLDASLTRPGDRALFHLDP